MLHDVDSFLALADVYPDAVPTSTCSIPRRSVAALPSGFQKLMLNMRRRCLCRTAVPVLDLPGGQDKSQRVWPGRDGRSRREGRRRDRGQEGSVISLQ